MYAIDTVFFFAASITIISKTTKKKL